MVCGQAMSRGYVDGLGAEAGWKTKEFSKKKQMKIQEKSVALGLKV